MTRIPTADRIQSVCGVDRETALAVRRILDGRMSVDEVLGDHDPYRPYVEYQMEAVDKLLGTCGVEAIESPDASWGRFWMDIVAVYANTGDSYGGTILYDVERRTFYATTWADWIETSERTGRYTFA